MTFNDIIKNVDKSKTNSSDNFDEIYEEFNLEYVWVDFEESLLRSFWYEVWMDTDTWVGSRVVFFKDEFVGVIQSTSRKSSPTLSWKNREVKNQVRQYLISLQEAERDYSDYIEPVCYTTEMEDTFQLTYATQLLQKEVIYLLSGEKCEVTQDFRKYSGIKDWGFVVVRFANGDVKKVSMKDVGVPYHIRGNDAN